MYDWVLSTPLHSIEMKWIIALIQLTKTLCEKCPYSEFFWSVFSRIRIEYGEIRSISPYSVRIRENTDQKCQNMDPELSSLITLVSTLLCGLCNKVSSSLKFLHRWHGFCQYSDSILRMQMRTRRYRQTHTHTHLRIHIQKYGKYRKASGSVITIHPLQSTWR